MSATVFRQTTTGIEPPSAAWRSAALEAPPSAHASLVDNAGCLHVIEAGGVSTREAGARLRVVAWNAERLKHVEASATALSRLDADVLLLTEVDRGMARSGNRHTARDLATALGMGWRFAVEFVELGLGDANERARHAGGVNVAGLHGAAIVSRLPLHGERLVRLGDDGFWFSGERKGERRIGGRIVLTADVEFAGATVRFAAVHLESHSDPDHRAMQTAVLLDRLAPSAITVVGGDFNTKEAGDATDFDEEFAAVEPLFARLTDAGFTWRDANAPGPTQRRHDVEPSDPLRRLDWLFVRGLRACGAQTVPALAVDGTVLADHEMIVCDLELP